MRGIWINDQPAIRNEPSSPRPGHLERALKSLSPWTIKVGQLIFFRCGRTSAAELVTRVASATGNEIFVIMFLIQARVSWGVSGVKNGASFSPIQRGKSLAICCVCASIASLATPQDCQLSWWETEFQAPLEQVSQFDVLPSPRNSGPPQRPPWSAPPAPHPGGRVGPRSSTNRRSWYPDRSPCLVHPNGRARAGQGPHIEGPAQREPRCGCPTRSNERSTRSRR